MTVIVTVSIVLLVLVVTLSPTTALALQRFDGAIGVVKFIVGPGELGLQSVTLAGLSYGGRGSVHLLIEGATPKCPAK